VERIIEKLLENIRSLGIEAVMMPQKASVNLPRFELRLAGIEGAGIDRNNPKEGKLGWERITFTAEFRSDGTHIRWVTDTILALRKILPLNGTPMRVSIKTDQTYELDAVWRRLSPGRFEYDEESPMPERFVEPWEVSIAYPARIIGQTSPEEEI